ncbi:MAG: hypothetical protein KatS3mg100_590 [Candidatus Parcubacteria bacterium]|nr:MAG: hypothetical protein KatS3mg100_590 [Candidatus Parcubacteria bacterium]
MAGSLFNNNEREKRGRTIVFDIETVGEPFDELDATTQEILTKPFARPGAPEETAQQQDARLEAIKSGMGISPLTGFVVAVGMEDVEAGKRAVYYTNPNRLGEEWEEDGVQFRALSERDILAEFWRVAEHYHTFVTFNGRSFDAPFLMLRSAVHNVRPSKNLVAARYVYQHRPGAVHIDLLEQLTFYGALQRAGSRSLHMFCRAFGIPSPKEEGTGAEVAAQWQRGEYEAIARYNVSDVAATSALYKAWQRTLGHLV